MDQARDSAAANLRAVETNHLDAIIINAAGCGSTLKEYGHLLHGNSCEKVGADFSSRVRDLSEFLVASGFLDRAFRPWPGRVTYHDACHLAHAQRITHEPRQLVRKIAGANYVELPEADLCCGSAGSYNLTEPEMASRLQARKIRNIARTGADTIVTTNPGCILQIRSGIEKILGKPLQVIHLADFLAQSLPLDNSALRKKI
jgi:glycolate oxidase iron-sulfur subunit